MRAAGSPGELELSIELLVLVLLVHKNTSITSTVPVLYMKKKSTTFSLESVQTFGFQTFPVTSLAGRMGEARGVRETGCMINYECRNYLLGKKGSFFTLQHFRAHTKAAVLRSRLSCRTRVIPIARTQFCAG